MQGVKKKKNILSQIQIDDVVGLKESLTIEPHIINYYEHTPHSRNLLGVAVDHRAVQCCKYLVTHKGTVVDSTIYNTRTQLMLIFSKRIYYRDETRKIMKLLIRHGANTFGWQKWGAESRELVIPIMVKWRSYLPEWSIFTHEVYPQEFKDLATTCMCVWNRLNITRGYKISRDIKRMLIMYIAKDWRRILDTK